MFLKSRLFFFFAIHFQSLQCLYKTTKIVSMIHCSFYCREQCDREQALDDFKTGRVRVLIATDVASRGLDIKGVT